MNAVVFSKLPENAVDKISIEGIAEFRSTSFLIVDAQKLSLDEETKWDEDEFKSINDIPLGYKVEAKGFRMKDGSVLAKKIEVKPNKTGIIEEIIIETANEIEKTWNKNGYASFIDNKGNEENVGKLIVSGKEVDRIQTLLRAITPPYLKERDLHLYVIDNKEWNAFVLANGSIYVLKGLLDSMNDDEIAIILGHELAHYTYKHSYSKYKIELASKLALYGINKIKDKITDDERMQYAIKLSGGMLSVVGKNQYSQSNEIQADRIGLRYAAEAGFDVTKSPDLWVKFGNKYTDQNGLYNFFMGDHPTFNLRMNKLREEIKNNYKK